MEQMWEKLQLKRIYTKPKGKQPDYTTPVVLRKNASTVEDFVSNKPRPTRNVSMKIADPCILVV
jgi:ribosome-interacting GTPase 1